MAKHKPNDQQQAVIDFELAGEGSLNLVARAGTGKTSTLLMLLPYTSGDVFFGAFNKAISLEIASKVNFLPIAVKSRVEVATMHSAGLRALTKSGIKSKIEKNKLWAMTDALAEGGDGSWIKFGSFIRSAVSMAKQAGLGITGGDFKEMTDKSAWLDIIDHFNLEDKLPADPGDNCPSMDDLLGMCQDLYLKSLRACKQAYGPFIRATIDFDDMLLAPLFYECRYQKYDRVLLDEAQDTNDVRREQALRMLRSDGRLIAVGDPNQAIYGFTGANSNAMDLIKAKLGSTELPLTVTYRCPKSVVALAQQWVPDIVAHESAPEGIVGEVWMDPSEQPEGAPGFWDSAPFTPDDAILCRNTKPLVSLAYEFVKRHLPVMVEGRDIGNGLIVLAERFKVTQLMQLEEDLEKWRAEEIAKWEKKRQDRKVAEVDDKADTLIVLIQAARDRGGSRVQDVIDLINLIFGDIPDGGRPNCVTLATVHRSKGREWPRVFILGRDRYMPSKFAKKPWEQEQEKNLMYVAVTRSMGQLIDIHVPEDSKKRGGNRPAVTPAPLLNKEPTKYQFNPPDNDRGYMENDPEPDEAWKCKCGRRNRTSTCRGCGKRKGD